MAHGHVRDADRAARKGSMEVGQIRNAAAPALRTQRVAGTPARERWQRSATSINSTALGAGSGTNGERTSAVGSSGSGFGFGISAEDAANSCTGGGCDRGESS